MPSNVPPAADFHSLRNPVAVDTSPHHEELTPEELGATIRNIRMQKKMRQGDLADAADLSASFISQFERGRTDTSISSLSRICLALGITVGSLFKTEPETVKVVPVEAIRTIELNGAIKRVYTRPETHGTDVYVVELGIDADTGTEQYSHDNEHELIICIAGFIALEIGSVQHVLRPGDSIDYDSETPHRLANIGSVKAQFTWIITDRPTV